jgi:very-short-patch-repair endonuclease
MPKGECKHSKKTRRRISRIVTHQWENEEYRKHMVRVHKLKLTSVEKAEEEQYEINKLKEKLRNRNDFCKCGCGETPKSPGSDYCLGHWMRIPEAHKFFSNMFSNLWQNNRSKMMEGARKRSNDPDWIRRNARALKRQKHNPQYWKNLAKALRSRPTKIEVAVEKLLVEMKLKYKAQAHICGFIADFLIENSLVIECDGTYWHSLPDRIRRDKIKDVVYKKNGYKVLRLTEYAIKNYHPTFLKGVIWYEARLS